MAIVPTVKSDKGYLLLKKTGGAGPLATGREIFIPCQDIQPFDPQNFTYIPGINATMFQSLAVQGGYTPAFTATMALKSSWSQPALFSSALMAFDVNNDGDTFAGLIDDNTGGGFWDRQVFDGCKCIATSFYQSAPGGAIQVDMGFAAVSAQGATGFTSAIAPDAGFLIGRGNVDYGAVAPMADGVQSWRLNVIRAGAQQFWLGAIGGTLYADHVASGGAAANFELFQTPKYNYTPTNALTIRLGIGMAGGGGTLLTVTGPLNFDGGSAPMRPGSARLVRKNFTLIDLVAGGACVAFN